MSEMNVPDTLAWRFIEGKVFSKSKNVVHLDVNIDHPHKIRTARLAIDPDREADYPIKASVPLFILKPGHGHERHRDTPFWHVANGPMAELDKNPWLLEQISNGDVVEGTVSRYVEDYAAIVDLTHNLTQNIIWHELNEFIAFLHINDTPGAGLSRDIRQLLHVGDCVQATVVRLDIDELKIDLSINEWIDLRRQECLAQSHKSMGNKSQPLPSVSEPPLVRSEKSLLLIDDDETFCRDMQKLLLHWQIKARYCHDLHGLEKELAVQKFDACLLDCNLGLAERERSEMGVLLQSVQIKQPQMRLASMTGDEASAEHVKEALLIKPLNIPQLLIWLDNGEIPKAGQTQRYLLFKNENRRWRLQGAEALVINRAQRLLKNCCDNINAHKALWVREERSGYYAIRAAYNIDEATCKNLEKHLQNSRIATSIETHEALEEIDHKTGPLHDVLGGFGFVYIMPFSSDGIWDRAVAFFSNSPLIEVEKKYLDAQRDHLEDLTYLMDAALALEVNEVFASQGMLLTSTIHELRTAASVVGGISQRVLERLALPIASLRDEIRDMVKASERLLELSENGLDKIRPEQQSVKDLKQLLESTLRLMRGRMHSLRINADLAPLNCSVDYPLTLPYPSKYVEIPLINLLDNALFNCGARDWARVEVTLSIDSLRPDLPILIQVEDNGLGMTAEQRKHLFTARKTGRGVAGCGMGLFLSRQLLEAVGGQIELAKTVRWIGSRFSIRLPALG